VLKCWKFLERFKECLIFQKGPNTLGRLVSYIVSESKMYSNPITSLDRP